MGSEMCIRDSSTMNEATAISRYLGSDQRIDTLVLVSSSYHMRRACLLYTSDAADDLLCVDLGGRRLIKKKKVITLSTDQSSR